MTAHDSLQDVGAIMFPADGRPPYAHLRESTTTFRRLIGQNEIGYALVRGPRGYADSFSIAPLACSGGHTIADDEVVQACAALRLRHPLLASKVAYSTEKPPELVVHSPMTEAHALREARAQIEFHAFHEQEAATEALRERWLSATPEDALDLRAGTCSLYWARDIDPHSGRYILGFMTPHFITDGRRRLNLVRCMLELLTTPGRAKRELTAHFSGKTPIVELPPSLEGLLPQMGASDLSEVAKAKAAFEELVKFRSKPQSGLVPDGVTAESKLCDRFIRKTWSPEDTKRILRACKTHGVTITHLANVASAFASVQRPGPAGTTGGSSDEDKYYFEFSSAFDVNAKVPRFTSLGEIETALRIVLYPIVIAVARADVAESVTCKTIWGAAQQFKEKNDAFVKSPYFWYFCGFYGEIVAENYMAQMAGKPFMPYMSSMGDLKSVLPVKYPVQHAKMNGATNGTATSGSEVRILDQISAGKIDPSVANFLMYTFDERLNLQFKWNAGRTSDALIIGWFNRVVEIITQVATDEA